MKRKVWKQFCAGVLTMIFILVTPLACSAASLYGSNSKLPVYSKNVIAPKISDVVDQDSEYVIELKENGLYDNYIKLLREKWPSYIQSEKLYTLDELSQNHISSNTTMSQLKQKAQDELNQNHDGIKIGSSQFTNLLNTSFQDEENSLLDQIYSKEKPLFYFMSVMDGMLYNDDGSSIMQSYHLSKPDDFNLLTLSDLAEMDAERNFADTVAPALSYSFAAKSSTWPKLNSNKISDYAYKHALKGSYNTKDYLTPTPRADCTNFASQCLHAGGLGMRYTSKEAKNHKNLTVSKEISKWYNLKKSNNISTTWIRVVELYKYLAPHYQTFESRSKEKMNKQLKYGYLMQGRKIFRRYSHSVITTKTLSGHGMGYCAHSASRRGVGINYFYTYGHYIEYRIVKVC